MHQSEATLAPARRCTRVLTSAAVLMAGAIAVVVMSPAPSAQATTSADCAKESQTSAQWSLVGNTLMPHDDVYERSFSTGTYALSVPTPATGLYASVLENDKIYNDVADKTRTVSEYNTFYRNSPGLQAKAVLDEGPQHAKSFVMHDDGFDWVPVDGYTGGDTFTYMLYAAGRCAEARVTILPTTAATPVDDRFVGYGDDPIDASLFGVLANDFNADPTATQVSAIVPCTVNGAACPGAQLRPVSIRTFRTGHGELTINPNGTFEYRPDPGFRGTDQFVYIIVGGLNGRPGRVDLEVRELPPALQPLARNDRLEAVEDTALTIGASRLLANDTDSAFVPYAYDPAKVATREFSFDTPHGSVSVSYGGALPYQYVGTMTYTPDSDYHGPDHFLYTSAANNPGTQSNVARVEIDVAPRPDKPRPQPDFRDIRQGQSITVDVLANDLDDDPFLAPTRVERFPSSCITCNGTWVVNPDNTVTYTPTPGFVGVAAWDYSVFDADGERGDSYVWLNIARDDARDDAYDASEDTPLVVDAPGLKTNDPNPAIATSAPEVVDAPAHGDVTVATDGGFRYTPAADYHGADSFTYAYRDAGTGQLGDTGTVSVNVAAVNDAPKVSLNTFCRAGELCILGEVRDVQEGGTVTVNGMVQDKEFNVGDLTVAWGDGSSTTLDYPCAPDSASCPFSIEPTYSSLCIQCVDALYFRLTHRYTDDPAGDSDLYTISATADDGASSTTTTRAAVSNMQPGLEITTLGPIDAVAGTPLTIHGTVDDLDQPPVWIDWGDGSASERATVDACVLGTTQCTWSATHTYSGSASRTITATADDRDGGVGTDTVAVAFAPEPDWPPVARPVEATVDEDGVLHVVAPGLLSSASDPDGDLLTVVDHSAPEHGSVLVGTDGEWTYVPQADYHGPDTFTYTVGAGAQQATGSVSVTVRPVNDAPSARDVGTSTSSGTPVTVPGDVSDVDGDPLTLDVVSQPGHGTAEIVGDRLRYTPAAGWAGEDSFTYRAFDGTAYSPTATVSVTTLNAANQPPTLSPVADVTGVYSDALTPVPVSAVDDRTAPAALTFTATGLPAGLRLRSNRDGTATVVGTVTAKPGRYRTTVRACDADRACATTGFAITVQPETTQIRVMSSTPVSVAAGKAGRAPTIRVKARVTEADDGSFGALGRITRSSVRITATPTGGGSTTACRLSVSRRVAATSTSPGYANVSCTFAKGLRWGVYEIGLSLSGSFAGSESALLNVYDPKAKGASGAGTVALDGGGSLQFAFQGVTGVPAKGKGALLERNAAGDVVRAVRGMTLSALTTRTAPAKSAQLTGKATVDDVGGYGFVLTATDRGRASSTVRAPDTLDLQVTAPSGAPSVPSLSFPARPLVPGGNVLIR